MQTQRPPLRLGRPVRFSDRWQGRLSAFQVDDDWLILNVVVSHGLIRATEARLPFSAVIDWGDEFVAFDCTSREAFRREVPPLASAGPLLSSATRVSLAGSRLAGALVQRSTRRASHLLLAAGFLGSRMTAVPAESAAFEAGVLTLATQAAALPPYRADADLLVAVRDALVEERRLTADDRRALVVEVADGTAHLSGNIRTPQAEARAIETAAAVPGITSVRSSVVNDHRLDMDIARALDAAGLTRYGRVYVRSALGEVTLAGSVSAPAAVDDIVRVAGAVAGVRSVVDRIEVRERPARAAAAAGAAGQPSG
jgi:osmotically-inducible protein OsmY